MPWQTSFEIDALTLCIASSIAADQGKRDNVDPAGNDLLRPARIHTQTAGGRRNGTTGFLRQSGHGEKDRVKKRFAPTLEVHPGRTAHQGLETDKGVHCMSRPRHCFCHRGVRTIATTPEAARADLHLQAVKLQPPTE